MSPTPPGRRTRRPPRRRLAEAERRDQIIRATIETVATAGYEGASLARIADCAQVSKGLVSHYFGDKQHLMRATATATLDSLRDSIADSLDLTAPVPDVIRNAIRHAAALPASHRAELTALNRIILNLRASNGSQLLSLRDLEETYQMQEALFRRGQQEGTLRDFDTRVMAITYQSAIDAMLAYLDEHPEIDSHHYADELADVIIAAVRRAAR